MANTEEKIYTQFFPDSMSEDIIKAGKLSTVVDNYAYKGKSCAYYFYHSSENSEHTLNLYILPTDYPNAEGVQCMLPMGSDVPLTGMALVACRAAAGDIPYISKHPHLGEICVFQRHHLREKLWTTCIELLELHSSSQSVQDIDAFLTRMTLSCAWLFSFRMHNINLSRLQIRNEETRRYDSELSTEDIKRMRIDDGVIWDDNNDAPEFIAEMLQTADEDKRKCFEEFKKLFSLSSLYVEYQICESLKQQGKHASTECMLCMRICQNNSSREVRPVFNKEGKSINEDLLSKIELLLDLKAIGYNINGSRLMINKKLYAKAKSITFDKKSHIPVYVAIAAGELPWIQAFIAVGIDLKDFSDGALLKFTLSRTPKSMRLTTLDVLLANGIALTQNTSNLLFEHATNAIQANNHTFLQWIINKSTKLDLISLIDVSAGLSHHGCLKVGSFN